jgi:hypothetical protein
LKQDLTVIDMQGDLDSVLIEIEILAASTREDFKKGFWDNYIKYLEQYNNILSKLHTMKLLNDVSEIEAVSEEHRAYLHVGFSSEEQAKMREITNAASVLANKLKLIVPKERKEQVKEEAIQKVENLCSRFHIIARQIRQRHGNLATLEIHDEYDVQDLMCPLLRVYFDDIRVEDWLPSYAGGASRIDFILKQERIVVEAKMTRAGLEAKQVGEQLIVDIVKYKNSADCGTLVCFVYDPEGRIANPRGLETDLEKTSKELKIRVLIRPTGE